MVTALLVVTRVNPISSALWLVLCFFSFAGLYVMLHAHFIAAIQILLYAGAIMVLFTFVIMLLNIRKEELVYDRVTWRKTAVVLTALFFAGFLIWHFLKIPVVPFAPVEEGFGEVHKVGRLMFLKYLIPFELTSVLLLVAIIGALVLGEKEEK